MQGRQSTEQKVRQEDTDTGADDNNVCVIRDYCSLHLYDDDDSESAMLAKDLSSLSFLGGNVQQNLSNGVQWERD